MVRNSCIKIELGQSVWILNTAWRTVDDVINQSVGEINWHQCENIGKGLQKWKNKACESNNDRKW